MTAAPNREKSASIATNVIPRTEIASNGDYLRSTQRWKTLTEESIWKSRTSAPDIAVVVDKLREKLSSMT